MTTTRQHTATYSAAAERIERARTVATTEADALGELENLYAATQLVADLTARAVDAARRDGASWSQIGAALNMSKQAAQQRFSPAKPPRSTAGDPTLPLEPTTQLEPVDDLEDADLEDAGDPNEPARLRAHCLTCLTTSVPVNRHGAREWDRQHAENPRNAGHAVEVLPLEADHPLWNR